MTICLTSLKPYRPSPSIKETSTEDLLTDYLIGAVAKAFKNLKEITGGTTPSKFTDKDKRIIYVLAEKFKEIKDRSGRRYTVQIVSKEDWSKLCARRAIGTTCTTYYENLFAPVRVMKSIENYENNSPTHKKIITLVRNGINIAFNSNDELYINSLKQWLSEHYSINFSDTKLVKVAIYKAVVSSFDKVYSESNFSIESLEKWQWTADKIIKIKQILELENANTPY